MKERRDQVEPGDLVENWPRNFTVSIDEGREDEVEGGAELLLAWALELGVYPLLDRPDDETDEDEKGQEASPEIHLKRFQKYPAVGAVVLFGPDEHPHSRPRIRQRKIYVLRSIGHDGYVSNDGVVFLFRVNPVSSEYYLHNFSLIHREREREREITHTLGRICIWMDTWLVIDLYIHSYMLKDKQNRY